MEPKSTHQQELFAQLVVRYGNQRKALGEAYPRTLKWNVVRQHARASELAAMPGVAARIADLKRAVRERNDVALDDLIRAYKRIAFASLGDVLEEGPDGKFRLKPLEQWTEDELAAVKVLKVGPGGSFHISFHDPFPSLNALARHIGFYERDNAQQSNGLRELLQAISNRSLGLPEESEAQRN